MVLFSPWNRKKKPAPRNDAEASIPDGGDTPAQESPPASQAPVKRTPSARKPATDDRGHKPAS